MILTEYAIKTRTAVVVFALAAAVAGTVSYVTLPREGMPDITIPYVFVTAAYEGTSPEEIEKLITIPLEKQLNDVDGVKEVRSSSSEGMVVITIEFLAGEVIETAKQRVKDKVDLARPDLPTDLDEPLVQALNVSSDVPVFRFALSGQTDPSRLKALAEDLQDRIEAVAGVKSVEIYGAREREIRVELDATRLAAYDIPVAVIAQRIVQENATLSAGNIEVLENKFQVRVPGEFGMAAELADVLLVDRPDRRVFLRDVATVTDTFKDLQSISRLNGQPCVSLMVKKRVGENSVALIRRVKATMAEFILPPGIVCTHVYDESKYVGMMVAELENSIASGSILVVVTLLVFLGLRNSLFVAIAIPLSMMIGFVTMSVMGASMNMIVLFSLVLATGMLVDNGIVIVENIYRLRSEGLDRVEAARQGAAEVAWPIITSTLTTIVAFVPLLFWPDIMGQFMSFLPKTLIIVLTASLFVGLIVNPAMCSFWVSRAKQRVQEGDHWFPAAYERLLRGALKHRAVIVLLGFAFLVLSVVVYVLMDRGVELFPEVEPRNATINVRFPQGTSIERTDAVLRRIEPLLAEHRDVLFALSTAGAAGGQFIGGASVGTHVGHIHVEFRDAEDREGSSSELVDLIRREVGVEPGAELTVEKEKEGPPTGAPVSIELSGDDFDTLSELARRVARDIATVPGLVDVQDDFEEALPELQFRVDRNRAASFGLDTRTVAQFLRTTIFGSQAGKFRVEDEEFDITLRVREDQRTTTDVLSRSFIPTAAGSVPLTSLGTIAYTGGRGTISRKDQKRVITIMGNNQDRGVDKIVTDIRERLKGLNLPVGYGIRFAGDTEEMQKNAQFLGKALLAAMGMIFVILVLEFNSTLHPFIISSSVVLSLVGVMWGLVLCGMRFGVIMTGLGVISLAGVVVNNAIVLIDCINQRRDRGMEVLEAIVLAGRTRLRPVLLTAVTTVLGLIPMAVGYSVEFHEWPPRIVAGAESSTWWAPMAVAVIFGLTVATVLTLVLVPVMYSLIESASAAARRALGRSGRA